MATYDIFSKLNQHFLTNWADTEIQFDGKTLTTTEMGTKWIGTSYAPVGNKLAGLSGSTTNCRIAYKGLYKVFCYAKNETMAYKLADDVKTFFNGNQIENIRVEIGQDNKVNNLDNTWHECLVEFIVEEL